MAPKRRPSDGHEETRSTGTAAATQSSPSPKRPRTRLSTLRASEELSGQKLESDQAALEISRLRCEQDGLRIALDFSSARRAELEGSVESLTARLGGLEELAEEWRTAKSSVGELVKELQQLRLEVGDLKSRQEGRSTSKSRAPRGKSGATAAAASTTAGAASGGATPRKQVDTSALQPTKAKPAQKAKAKAAPPRLASVQKKKTGRALNQPAGEKSYVSIMNVKIEVLIFCTNKQNSAKAATEERPMDS